MWLQHTSKGVNIASMAGMWPARSKTAKRLWYQGFGHVCKNWGVVGVFVAGLVTQAQYA